MWVGWGPLVNRVTQGPRLAEASSWLMVPWLSRQGRGDVASFALALKAPCQKWHATSLIFHWPKQVIWPKQAYLQRGRNENLSCFQWEKDWTVCEQPQGRPQHLRKNQPHQKSKKSKISEETEKEENTQWCQSSSDIWSLSYTDYTIVLKDSR